MPLIALSSKHAMLVTQVLKALKLAGARLTADMRVRFIQKAAAGSKSRAQAGAGQALLQVAEAASNGQICSVMDFQNKLEKALRGFREPSHLKQTRQHGEYSMHMQAIR